MLLARDFFPFALHHPPFSFHFIAHGVSLFSEDIYYIFRLKILYVATCFNFPGACSGELCIFICMWFWKQTLWHWFRDDSMGHHLTCLLL